MLKHILQFCLAITPTFLFAQAQELTLLGNWQDDSLVETSWLSSRYNEVWGVAINDLEIAIIGSTEGTHFIDVTDPNNPTEIEAAFTPGAFNGPNLIHKDFHHMGNYLYVVADEGPSTLQIIDMSGLPESVEVVYDSDAILRTSHNIFIDEGSQRIYSAGGTFNTGANYNFMVISIEDPENPTLLGAYPNADLPIPYAHDMYVRNDTAYLNNGGQGFRAYDFTDMDNPQLLGTLTEYPESGYNHAGWLNEEGRYYYMLDETHGSAMKVIDVCDFTDMESVKTFDTGIDWEGSIAHNAIVQCNMLYTSYYYEGVEIFDISDPANPVRAYYYDTFDGPNEEFFAGAWGVFPLLPSGNILVSDMQGGLFVLGAIEENCAYNMAGACEVEVNSIDEIPSLFTDMQIFPQPATDQLNVQITTLEHLNDVHLSLQNNIGQTVQIFPSQNLIEGQNNISFNLNPSLSTGFYVLYIESNQTKMARKVVIER